MSPVTTKLIFFGLLICGITLEIFADISFKKWTLNDRTTFLAAGFVLYLLSSIFWAISLKYELLSKAISIFTILNFIAIVLVGLLLFKENVSFVNKIGLALGILGIILMEI